MLANRCNLSIEQKCGWILCSSTSIVRQCEQGSEELLANAANAAENFDVHRLKSLRSQCGEMMAFALDRVEKLGLEKGFLQFRLIDVAFKNPNISASNETQVDADSNTDSVSFDFNDFNELLKAFSSRDSFETLFMSLSLMVERSFRSAGRGRFALRVLQRLGLLHFRYRQTIHITITITITITTTTITITITMIVIVDKEEFVKLWNIS